MIKSKKGSHVGMMLSFVVFITFLIFLYSILSPTNRVGTEKVVIMQEMKPLLIEELNVLVPIINLYIPDVGGKDCVRFQSIVGELITTEDLLIKDGNGEIRNYSVSGQALTIHVGEGFSGFLKIFYADNLEKSPYFEGIGCFPITQTEYEVEQVEDIEYITENNLNNMMDIIQNYEEDYEELKEELNIPEGNDFAIEFIDKNGISYGTESVDLSTNIYVEEIPIQYLDDDGNINSGYLKIYIW